MRILLFAIISVCYTGVHSQGIITASNIKWSVVRAKIINRSDGKSATGVSGYLSLPGKTFQFAADVSDVDGNLSFLVKTPTLPTAMILQADSPNFNLLVDAQGSVLHDFPFDSMPSPAAGYLDTLPFYGMPDKRYLLDDYTRFATMEEVLIEYVGEVRIRRMKGKLSLEVLNIPYQIFFSDPPLVLLDGIPVFDIEKLMKINPLQIQKLEVVARKYYFGALSWPGIVSLSTYDGEFAGYQLPPSAVVTE